MRYDNYNYEIFYNQIISKMSKEDLIEDLRLNNKYSIVVKTTKAGKFLDAEIYPCWKNKENLTRIKKEIKKQREQQENLNDKNRKKKIIRIAHNNFNAGIDFKLGLSFKNIVTIEEARKELRNFFKRLKRSRKKAVKENDLKIDDNYLVKYLYVIEKGSRSKKVHVHMYLNSIGIDNERDIIENIWGKGFCNTDRLQETENGFEDLSKYMAKTLKDDDKNNRRWSYSKNLKIPIPTKNHTLLTKKKLRMFIQEENNYKYIFEKVYKGYKFLESETYINDKYDGCYVRVKMRLKE